MLIQTSTQYSVMVPDAPGELAKLTSALLSAGANLDGIVSMNVGRNVCVKFIGEPSHDAVPALRSAGYVVCETTVLRLWAPPMQDFVHRVAMELARHGIVATSLYGHTAKDGANYILAVDKPREAASALSGLYSAVAVESLSSSAA